ncbi:hypothetical protein F2Q69_00049299 [Brassica cretica]|uniref:Uncharacterized protein n=1 Tax=Brassica cretica TaxID=69181 RepID=A0A8S9PTV9_BRACR|nr:hypothetical protein F2Q69_00049299 [Brassica cretica]
MSFTDTGKNQKYPPPLPLGTTGRQRHRRSLKGGANLQSPSTTHNPARSKKQIQKIDPAKTLKTDCFTTRPSRHSTRRSLNPPERDAPCARSTHRRNEPAQDRQHIEGGVRGGGTAKVKREEGREAPLAPVCARTRGRTPERNILRFSYRERREMRGLRRERAN